MNSQELIFISEIRIGSYCFYPKLHQFYGSDRISILQILHTSKLLEMRLQNSYLQWLEMAP